MVWKNWIGNAWKFFTKIHWAAKVKKVKAFQYLKDSNVKTQQPESHRGKQGLSWSPRNHLNGLVAMIKWHNEEQKTREVTTLD